ncbi:unnamed protein product [Notodromas monacha]|uniref:Aquaporin n=1 Tax=Notodromas monacha TaxID=399045 RepID=A0A7R9C028_9CRUS|nr:unnamed protein product [Notodromas monacha]CAG0923999.1 unnamed protein product [Notodromas monacha]
MQVCDHFGVLYYGIGLFLAVLWWAMTWEEAKACPYFHFADMLTRKRGMFDGLSRIAVETVAGLLVYPFVWTFWALGLSTEHRQKAFDLRCITDMQVSPMNAALVEGAGTMACVLFSLYINSKASWKISAPLDALVSSILVCFALNYTGGYYNPVLATSLKLGCDNDDYVDHLAVYWLASSLGCIFACLAFESPLLKSKQKAE